MGILSDETVVSVDWKKLPAGSRDLVQEIEKTSRIRCVGMQEAWQSYHVVMADADLRLHLEWQHDHSQWRFIATFDDIAMRTAVANICSTQQTSLPEWAISLPSLPTGALAAAGVGLLQSVTLNREKFEQAAARHIAQADRRASLPAMALRHKNVLPGDVSLALKSRGGLATVTAPGLRQQTGVFSPSTLHKSGDGWELRLGGDFTQPGMELLDRLLGTLGSHEPAVLPPPATSTTLPAALPGEGPYRSSPMSDKPPPPAPRLKTKRSRWASRVAMTLLTSAALVTVAFLYMHPSWQAPMGAMACAFWAGRWARWLKD